MKVIIIVALYYPHYYEKVRKEILSIFSDFDFKVLFVDNSDKLLPENEPEHNVSWLKGSNAAGEFSAWDEGYAFINETSPSADKDIIFFLNDTFCHHRVFTFYDRYLYRKAVRNCGEAEIYGEINSIGTTFAINQLPFTSWLSSYVFLSARKNIDKVLPFNNTSAMSSEAHTMIESGLAMQKVQVPMFSENLNQHLSHWLFPINGKGWYNAGKTSSAILLFKLKAIINEKLLTYHALNNKLVVQDIYHGKINRIYNSLRNKIYSCAKKYKMR